MVEADGAMPFSHLITTDGIRLNRNDTVVAISADPSRDWAVALQQIQRRGVNSVAVIIDGSTFGRTFNYDALLIELEAAGISTYRVRRNDPIDKALAAPARAATWGRHNGH